MDSKKRTFLQGFYEKEIIPLFEKYWIDVFTKRLQNEFPTTVMSAAIDCLKPVQIVNPETKKREMGVMLPIEDARPFWDSILVFYPLFFPHIYANEGEIAKELLEEMKHTFQPMNLTNESYSHLINLANGSTYSMFWQHPIEIVPTLKILQLMAANYPKKKEDLEKFNEQVEKWKDQAIEEEGKRLENYENEWKNEFLGL